MKRSYVIESIVYNCLSRDGLDTSGVDTKEIANDILTHLESLGFALVETYGDYEKFTDVVPYEPEEGWDAWLEEQHKKDQARDFKVHVDQDEVWGRSKQIALEFLEGKSFEELAEQYNVTRERIRRIVAKERRRYQKHVEESGE